MTDAEEPTDDDTPADSDGDVVRRDRFSGGPARSFLSSLAADKRIFEADVAVDRAHVVMLAEAGILDASTAGDILGALADIETAGHEALPDGEDVHAAIETAVINRIGEDGGRMHTARSRNDEVAACIRYRLREDLLSVTDAIIDLRETLLAEAAANAETLMPGYTHLQPAQPITVGFWLASYESALQRDTTRLLDAYTRVNQSPLGGAAFAGTTFDIDRARTAELLGFDGIIENAMDATIARDVLIETINATVTTAMTCAGLAEDGILFANRGFLTLDDDYASTSSIMPQKKNPDTLELARATAGDVLGAYTDVATTLKGLPRAYNRDLQRAGPPVWDAIDRLLETVDVIGGAMATATWNDEPLQEAAEEGFATATGVADLLAQEGLPFRTAHEIVAHAATDVEAATDLGEAIAILDAAGEAVTGTAVTEHVTRAQLETALDPMANVRMRDSTGGPAPTALTAAIETAQQSLQDDRETLTTRQAAVETAHDQLLTEVDSYV